MFLMLAFVCGADPTFTVENRCPPVFAVANKCPAPVAVRTGYPVRGSWWSGCPDWTHLTRGEHAGQFPAEWLKTLTYTEVQSVHSDAHEGKVRWEYVPGRTTKKLEARASIEASPGQFTGNFVVSGAGSSLNPSSTVPFTLPASQSSCPGGVCPQSSYSPPVGIVDRIFGRR